jgi:hypothetical protein
VNLERLLFKVVILLLPTQLTLHFWPDWAYIFGIRIDYLAPVIYFIDIPILLLVSIWLKRVKFRQLIKPSLIFALFAFTNTIFSNNQIVTLSSWIKLIPDILFGIYVYENSKKVQKAMIAPLKLSLTIVSTLAILQFIKRGSLGGLFYWIGERELDIFTPSIAKTTLLANDFLRPYSTFPHPNALAGFIAATLIFLYFKKSISKKFSTLLLLTIIITFSRNALIGLAAVYALSSFTKLNLKHFGKATLLVLIIFSLTLSLLASITNIGAPSRTSISRRLQLIEQAGSIISHSPLIGSGLGTFPIEISKLNIRKEIGGETLDSLLQPVHNIYLLALGEGGFVGLLIFFIILSTAFSKPPGNRAIDYVILLILLTGFLDHYWLTIKQTRLLFILFIALALAGKSGRIGTSAKEK